MRYFKLPSEYINDYINTLAAMKLFQEEYSGNKMGSIYNKRRIYYTNKLENLKNIISNYCTSTTSSSIKLWLLKVEIYISEDIIEEKVLEIYLDGRMDRTEVSKLIQFNLNCIILEISLKSTKEIGKIKFL